MKYTFLKIILTVFLLLSAVAVHAQDYAGIDATVKAYKAADIDKLAAQINKDFKREDEKARAIFTWLATNVKYDIAALNKPSKGPVGYSYRTEEERQAIKAKIQLELANKTFKSKKAVCEGYANLFAVLAQKTGLQAEVIAGTAKSHPNHIGKLPVSSDHAWNAVKIGNEWKLLDATWGAGTVTGQKPEFNFRFNDGYFFTDPDIFFLNHFPEDKKWLLTNKSKEEFAELPLYYGNYIAGGYEFVSPNAGTFKNMKPSAVPFRVKNLQPSDVVAYAFSSTNAYTPVKPSVKGDVSEFDVTFDNRSKGYLTIYINDRSVASYKIN